MELFIVHYYDDTQYEENLEIKAICVSEDKANEICNKLNNGYDGLRYNYVTVDSDEEFDDNILKW